jgi:hypothetical protein
VTESAGRNLLDWGLASRQTLRIIFGGKVADQSGHPVVWAKTSERLFEECSLSRAGAGDETRDENSGGAKAVAKGSGHDVVLL